MFDKYQWLLDEWQWCMTVWTVSWGLVYHTLKTHTDISGPIVRWHKHILSDLCLHRQDQKYCYPLTIGVRNVEGWGSGARQKQSWLRFFVWQNLTHYSVLVADMSSLQPEIVLAHICRISKKSLGKALVLFSINPFRSNDYFLNIFD